MVQPADWLHVRMRATLPVKTRYVSLSFMQSSIAHLCELLLWKAFRLSFSNQRLFLSFMKQRGRRCYLTRGMQNRPLFLCAEMKSVRMENACAPTFIPQRFPWNTKRAHGGRMRTYIRPVALLLRSTRIENFVGAHPFLMRAFAGLDLQQPSVIQSEATVREQSVESRHEHG